MAQQYNHYATDSSLLAQLTDAAEHHNNHGFHLNPQYEPVSQQPPNDGEEDEEAEPAEGTPGGSGHIKRNAYTDAMKAALRAERRKNPQNTQRSLRDWFYNQYGMKIHQSTVSIVLRDDHANLDTEQASNSQVKRHRSSDFPALEDALFDWQKRTEEQGTHVTSDMIRDVGKRLWDTMDCYVGKPAPSFSNGWLAGYKARYALPVKHKSSSKRKADEAHTRWRPDPPSRPTESTTNAAVPPPPIPRHPPYSYHPRPAYVAHANSPIYGRKQLYTRIAATATSKTARILTHAHTIAPRSGHAFKVPSGHIVRITAPSGPQVGDLNIWSMHNPRERFWAARTRQLHASHVRVFDRLWSCLPYLRPMATIVADSLAGYGVDGRGGRCHDLLGTQCDPYMRKMFTKRRTAPPISGNLFDEPVIPETADAVDEDIGNDRDLHCHSNLVRAVMPHRLVETDLHDPLSVFQISGLDHDGRYFVAPCPSVDTASGNDNREQSNGHGYGAASSSTSTLTWQAPPSYAPATQGQRTPPTPAQRPQAPPQSTPSSAADPDTSRSSRSDYIELFAEIDLLIALSACPGGADPAAWNYGRGGEEADCRGLQVDVYRIWERVSGRAREGWLPPKVAFGDDAGGYAGCHGLSSGDWQ